MTAEDMSGWKFRSVNLKVLQWSRGQMTAEGPPGCPSPCSRNWRFNGAAAR